MALPHGNVAIDLDVKIDIETETHFADKTFVDSDDAGNGRRRPADTIDNCTPRRSIEKVINRGPKETHADTRHHETNENGSPIIGAPPSLTADERDRDSNERRDRAENVGPMTPGIRFDGDTLDRATETEHVTKERFFDDDNHQENQQRERGRRGMRQKHCPRAFRRKRNGRKQNAARHKNCGQWFGLAVTVRMGRVRRPRRETQTTPDDNRTGDIERRFHSIRDESVGISENATADFDDGKGDVHDQAKQRQARAGLQITRGRLRMRRRVHRMNKTIKAIVYERHGNPAEVLQIKTEPWPEPDVDEAIVATRAAPINPADINAIEGKYPGRREVPAVPGFERAGVVD